MRQLFIFAATALTLTAATAANASEPAAISRDMAETMVEQIVHPVNGQIARYADGLCPVIVGVNEDFGHRVAERIREVARSAGAPVAAPGCAGNLMVVFTNDPATFFKSVAQDHPTWLQSVSRYSRNQLASSTDPLIAWQTTSTRDAEDQPMGSNVSAARPVSTIRVRDSSFTRPVTRQTIDNAFVLVSLGAIDGRPLFQVADNIALRALTPVDQPKSASVPTVLNAFEQEPGQAPSMMTAADLAFLRAVYSRDGMETAVVERHKLAEAMGGDHSG